ncbi:MAG: hypothetical protein N2109_08495 [Fimbriimonadales bacterium]|nr:hypothetical protein [Fimbriimonadales bacterium]
MTTLELSSHIRKLALLAEREPRRVAAALDALWALQPGLFQDMFCLESEDEEPDCPVRRDSRGQAVVGRPAVPVWEVVRAYRRVLDLQALGQEFPTLSQVELLAALEYSHSHREEIGLQIDAYENRRAALLSE